MERGENVAVVLCEKLIFFCIFANKIIIVGAGFKPAPTKKHQI